MGIMKSAEKNWVLVVLALVVVFYVGTYGFPKFDAASVVNQQPQVSIAGAGTCPDTGTIDLPFYAQASIADPTTGVKSGVMGTFSVYKKGDIIPYTSAISTTTASVGTTNDLPCGYSGAFVVLNSTTGYYPQKFDLGVLPNAASGEVVTRDLDAISTITLYGYNSSATGTQTGTSMSQKLAPSGTLSNLKIEIVSDGLKKVRKPMIGFKWCNPTVGTAGACANDASANETVTIYDTNWQVAQCGLGGTGFNDYDDCWTYNGNVENGASLFVNPQIVSAANFANDYTVTGINATVQVIDLGSYTASTGAVLFDGYANPATGARPTFSATAATFTIKFNGG